MSGTFCHAGHVRAGQPGQPLRGACPVVLLSAEMPCPGHEGGGRVETPRRRVGKPVLVHSVNANSVFSRARAREGAGHPKLRGKQAGHRCQSSATTNRNTTEVRRDTRSRVGGRLKAGAASAGHRCRSSLHAPVNFPLKKSGGRHGR